MHKFCICAKDKSRIVFARKSHDFPFNGNIFAEEDGQQSSDRSGPGSPQKRGWPKN
jgi:hypothetical protein